MKRVRIMNTIHQEARQRGFSIVEVLIGVAVFAIGMLALASLQGNLTRSASDANQRMIAINLAEELIETKRGFARMADPSGLLASYADISADEDVPSVEMGGTVFDINYTVIDNYYDIATDTFTTTKPLGVATSDYKRMQVTVTWTTPDFRTVEGEATSQGDIGTGSITLTENISSVSTQGSSLVATQKNTNPSPLKITYTPGTRPEVVSLSLGGSKFKESLTPVPDVIRTDELVETRFDVITYSTNEKGESNFVRLEEFAAVSCDCTLKAPSGKAETSGRRPAIWAGDEYAEGHWVDKPYGVSANNQQSVLCKTCCRDHHDGGKSSDDHADTAVNKISPFRAAADYIGDTSAAKGDHKHYARSRNGTLSTTRAKVGETYVEACRMVRVNGFFQLAQDFRQEDLNLFPGDFLDDLSEVNTYSAYATVAADEFAKATYPDYEVAPPCIGGPYPCVAQPTFGGAYPTALGAGEFPSWTTLPLGTATTQQMRSRGMYIDYLSSDLRNTIICLRKDGDADTCKYGDVKLDKNAKSKNILELIPFFDVQLTFLNRWNENPINIPVNTTNEELQDNNTHSRGLASRTGAGSSTVKATGNGNNLGFTNTLEIDPHFDAQRTEATITVKDPADGGGTGAGTSISGHLTETVAGNPSMFVVGTGTCSGGSGTCVQCDRTPDGYVCTVQDNTTTPRLEVYGYGKDGTDYWACSTTLSKNTQNTNGTTARAVFELAGKSGANFNINIQATACN